MVLQILFIKHYPSVLFNIYGGYSFNEVAFNLYFLFPANNYHNTGTNTHYSWIRGIEEYMTSDYSYTLAAVVKLITGEIQGK